MLVAVPLTQGIFLLQRCPVAGPKPHAGQRCPVASPKRHEGQRCSAAGPDCYSGRPFSMRGPYGARPDSRYHSIHQMNGSGGKLDARFVQDVTIFDGTELAPGTNFTKIWRLRNSGTLPWPVDTMLVHVGGDELGCVFIVPLEVSFSGYIIETHACLPKLITTVDAFSYHPNLLSLVTMKLKLVVLFLEYQVSIRQCHSENILDSYTSI